MFPSHSQDFQSPTRRISYNLSQNTCSNCMSNSEIPANENSQSNLRNFLDKITNQKFVENYCQPTPLVKIKFQCDSDRAKSIFLKNLLETIKEINLTYNKIKTIAKPNAFQIELTKSLKKFHSIFETFVQYEKFINSHQCKFPLNSDQTQTSSPIAIDLPDIATIKDFQGFLNFFHSQIDDDSGFEIIHQTNLDHNSGDQSVNRLQDAGRENFSTDRRMSESYYLDHVLTNIDYHLLNVRDLEIWLDNYQINLEKLIHTEQSSSSSKQKILNFLGISSTTTIAVKFLVDSVLPFFVSENEQKEKGFFYNTKYYSAAVLSLVALTSLIWNSKKSSNQNLELQNNLLLKLKQTSCALANYHLNIEREVF